VRRKKRNNEGPNVCFRIDLSVGDDPDQGFFEFLPTASGYDKTATEGNMWDA